MKYSEKIGFKVCNQETFLRAMNIINPKITILSEYINSSTPVEFLCECGEIHKNILHKDDDFTKIVELSVIK